MFTRFIIFCLLGSIATSTLSAEQETPHSLPNLKFRTPQGKLQLLSDLHGKYVLLHFWGSWCPPCRKEIPEIAKIYPQLKRAHVEVLLVNVGEDILTSQAWLRSQNISLPVTDAGATGDGEGLLWVANGKLVPERQIAPVFPSTYLLDPTGQTIFSHYGVVKNWGSLQQLIQTPAPLSSGHKKTPLDSASGVRGQKN